MSSASGCFNDTEKRQVLSVVGYTGRKKEKHGARTVHGGQWCEYWAATFWIAGLLNHKWTAARAMPGWNDSRKLAVWDWTGAKVVTPITRLALLRSSWWICKDKEGGNKSNRLTNSSAAVEKNIDYIKIKGKENRINMESWCLCPERLFICGRHPQDGA